MPRGSDFIEHSLRLRENKDKKITKLERCVFSTALPEVPHSDLRSHRKGITPLRRKIVRHIYVAHTGATSVVIHPNQLPFLVT